MPKPTFQPFQPNWRKLVPFVAIHVLTVWAAIRVPPTRGLLELAFWLYVARMFAITAGFHRYFSHRAFKTSRAFQFVLGVAANCSLMRGPLDWVSHHRFHHRHSDTERDLHSPLQRGFWWAHVGWFLSRQVAETKLFPVRDLERFPELVWLNRYYFLPSYTGAIVLYLVGGWPYVVWGFLVSTVFTWHVTFTINSLSHQLGSTRFATKDTSRNNFVLGLMTLGEGWHNNHHHDMSSARHGIAWWEIDLTYIGLRIFEALGLVWDLRPAPAMPVRGAVPSEHAAHEVPDAK